MGRPKKLPNENDWYEGKATINEKEVMDTIFAYVDEDKDLPFDIHRDSNDALVDFCWLFGVPDDRWHTMPAIVQLLCLMKDRNTVDDLINKQKEDNLKITNRADLQIVFDTVVKIGYLDSCKIIKKDMHIKHNKTPKIKETK